MISPEIFHRLRAAQHRSAHEQQLLSGRDWILVAGAVQLLSALYPLFSWINQILLGSGTRPGLHPGISVMAEVVLAMVLVTLWMWARVAPFRAAMVAIAAFLLAHGALGAIEPRTLLTGAIVKTVVLLGLLHAARTGYLRHRSL